jgi:hypothetical protein
MTLTSLGDEIGDDRLAEGKTAIIAWHQTMGQNL